MKKLIVALLSFCLWLPSIAHAEDLSVANGTYTSADASFIRSIVIEDAAVTLIFADDALSTHTADIYALHGQLMKEIPINPNLSPEEILKKRQELGIDVDMKALLKELAETVASDASPEDVRRLLESHIPGVYMHLAPTGTSYIYISHPYLAQDQSFISVQLFDNELFNLEQTDENTLTYADQTYVKE